MRLCGSMYRTPNLMRHGTCVIFLLQSSCTFNEDRWVPPSCGSHQVVGGVEWGVVLFAIWVQRESQAESLRHRSKKSEKVVSPTGNRNKHSKLHFHVVFLPSFFLSFYFLFLSNFALWSSKSFDAFFWVLLGLVDLQLTNVGMYFVILCT
jgi:hypothetical protein